MEGWPKIQRHEFSVYEGIGETNSVVDLICQFYNSAPIMIAHSWLCLNFA